MHPSHPQCPTHTLTLDPLPCKCNTPCRLRFRGSSIMYWRQFVQFKYVDSVRYPQARESHIAHIVTDMVTLNGTTTRAAERCRDNARFMPAENSSLRSSTSQS